MTPWNLQTQKQKKLKQSLLPWNAALPSLPSMPSRQQVKETSCGRQATPNKVTSDVVVLHNLEPWHGNVEQQ